MKSIYCYRLPAEADPDSLRNATVVVIDVLRATSTITTALANGAGKVIPCDSIEAAWHHREHLQDCLLCGERQGVMIDGFDLGNSPTEYTAERIGGRTLVFTTTNGTRAMIHSRQATSVLLASFLNLSAVITELADEATVHVICSGTDRTPTLEDDLLAGAIAWKLRETHQPENKTAIQLAESWQSKLNDQGQPHDLASELQKGQGGINLIKRGFEADIEECAKLDSQPIVGRYSPNKSLMIVSDQSMHSR